MMLYWKVAHSEGTRMERCFVGMILQNDIYWERWPLAGCESSCLSSSTLSLLAGSRLFRHSHFHFYATLKNPAQ